MKIKVVVDGWIENPVDNVITVNGDVEVDNENEREAIHVYGFTAMYYNGSCFNGWDMEFDSIPNEYIAAAKQAVKDRLNKRKARAKA